MNGMSYEFDPCAIDGSEQEQTLDNWKPTAKKQEIIQSQWRKDMIGNNFNQEPGLDELKKIMMYLKKKVSDSEIMNAFGITAETLIAIKNDNYDPVSGIKLNNQMKIYKEFKRIEEKIASFQRGINFFANIILTDHKKIKAYKNALKKPKVKKKIIIDNENAEMHRDFFDDEEE